MTRCTFHNERSLIGHIAVMRSGVSLQGTISSRKSVSAETDTFF